MSRVRVFLGCSLDGFIAGPQDELDWLDPPEGSAPPDEGDDHGFGELMAETGALLMGRRTYDVLTGFDVPWPYGERPLLVATHRPLAPSPHPVRALAGSIAELIRAAREAAGELDVYLDGGILIRQALDAELVDLLTLTIVPIVLGEGIPLFRGVAKRQRLELLTQRELPGGLVQLRYRVPRAQA